MPAHPTAACYCHVIDAGHTNLVRLHSACDAEGAAHELKHIRAVTAILADFLLYSPRDPRWSDSEHDRYWDVIRPEYILSASRESVLTYYGAWEFLALATRFDFREEIVEEGQLLRDSMSS